MGISNFVTRLFVQQKIDTATTTTNTSIATAVSNHNAAVGSHNLYFTTAPPSGTATSDYSTTLVARIGPGGKIWFPQADLTVTPTPTTPIVSTIGERFDFAAQHFVAAFLDANGVPVDSGTTTSLAVAQTLNELVLQRDKPNFERLLTWAETNLIRNKAGSEQSTFLKGYASAAAANGTVSSYTIHTGAEVKVMKACIRAWNLWGDTRYRDVASGKAALIKSLVITDEGRAYLGADETQVQITNGNHLSSGNPISKHRLSDYDLIAFRLGYIFTGDLVFKQLIEGSFDIYTKSTTQGALATAVGLFPEYVSFNATAHLFEALTSGTNGWLETQTTDFTKDAAQVVQYLAADRDQYSEPRATTMLAGNLKTKYAALWAGGVIYDRYTHAGVAVGTTQNTTSYLRAIFSLTTNEPGNAAAAAIRSTKLPTDLATDSFGRFFPDEIQGVTATATRDKELAVFLAQAQDSGKYKDISILGTNPSAGTTTGTTPVNPPVVVTPPTPVNTTGSYKLVADSTGLCVDYYNGLPSGTTAQQLKKTRVGFLKDTPQPFWTSVNWDADCHGAEGYINRVVAQGGFFFILSYSIPLRDLGQYSAGGATNDTEYRNWITLLATKIGTKTGAMCYEPDSLVHADDLTQAQRAGRMANMRWALAYLRDNCPNLFVYIDVGHPNWKSVPVAASLLQEVGVEMARGFCLNTSNFVDFSSCVTYGQSIRAITGTNAHFTIDTGRNGNPGAVSGFANPPRRRFGLSPQWGGFDTAYPGLDGVAWWKRPGESDGDSGDGAPSAGNFWGTYIYNDSVGDNVDTGSVSSSSGMAQRPPVPGVAIVPPT